jgi:hypothetical protein
MIIRSCKRWLEIEGDAHVEMSHGFLARTICKIVSGGLFQTELQVRVGLFELLLAKAQVTHAQKAHRMLRLIP